MTAIVLIAVFAAAIIGLSLAFGGPILALILGVVVVVGGIVWFIAAGSSKTSAGEVVRETHEQEFLGPGGPDDPT